MYNSDLKLQFEGKVVKGRGVGKRLGFPTANIATVSDLDLAYGVYFCSVECLSGEYYGVLHYGPRPTFDDSVSVAEVHLLDFDGDLTGEYVRVYVFDYLRETIKFKDENELKKYIEADIVRARELIDF